MDKINLCHMGEQGDLTLLQKAIDSAGDDGAHIIIPEGHWLMYPVRLKSNITLELQKGAILIADDCYDNYNNAITTTICEDSDRSFIYARNCENLRIIGQGSIDGQGKKWVTDTHNLESLGIKTAAIFRPRMIVFEDCHNITLQDFTVRDAPMWTIHLTACYHGAIERLTIDNDLRMPNTDAIDIDGCYDIHIKDCDLSAADDCICIKTLKRNGGEEQACHHVIAENCNIRSYSCAIKIGTETHQDIYDIHFRHCQITQSNRAMGVFVRDGAHIHDIIFEDIQCESHIQSFGHWGCGEAITVNSNIRNQGAYPGLIEDIIFKNIKAISYGAMNFNGMAQEPLKNIVLKNIDLTITAKKDSPAIYDLRPAIADNIALGEEVKGRKNGFVFDDDGNVIGIHHYPKYMPALWGKHMDGLRIENITMRYCHDTEFFKTQKVIQLMPSVTNIKML